MINDKLRSIAFDATLNLLPPSIRQNILFDKPFIQQLGVSTDIILTFGKDGPSFHRNKFFDCIRVAIHHKNESVVVEDQDNVSWELFAKSQKEFIEFSICLDDTCHSLSDFTALAEDSAIRTSWFERTAKDIYLDDSTYQVWLSRLAEEPLNNDEFEDLLDDLHQTPVNIYRKTLTSLEKGSLDLTLMVPSEPHYYERLVGRLGSGNQLEEYIDTGIRPLVADLQQENTAQGFLYALLACSSGHISEIIQIQDIDRKELIKAYQWLTEDGDPISRLAAVEIALFNLDSHPELAPFIEKIVDDIISEKPESDNSSFMLLSSLIIIIGAELARKCILGDAPPMYRKQAAIAQASLILRAFKEAHVEPQVFIEWTRSSRLGHIFILQGLIDLRREPRWLPEFISADQLRSEFIGRLLNATERNSSNIQTESLRILLLGPTSKIANAACWPFPILPGPLEGAINPRHPIPKEIIDRVTDALQADHLEANNFAGLVNASLHYNLLESHSSLAASALRRVQFSIENLKDEDTTFSFVGGLALLAAVTRGTELADTIRILVRVMRRQKRLAFEPEEELRIAIITAAAFENIQDWAKFLGEWITEISFETSDKNKTTNLLSIIQRLIQLEPTLARHCMIADAALRSL